MKSRCIAGPDSDANYSSLTAPSRMNDKSTPYSIPKAQTKKEHSDENPVLANMPMAMKILNLG